MGTSSDVSEELQTPAYPVCMDSSHSSALRVDQSVVGGAAAVTGPGSSVDTATSSPFGLDAFAGQHAGLLGGAVRARSVITPTLGGAARPPPAPGKKRQPGKRPRTQQTQPQ